MKEYMVVFLGGGLGSITRFGLSRLINYAGYTSFPVATLVINVLASFMLGLYVGFYNTQPSPNSSMRLFVAIGFCGGFSTFSTFSNETLTLIRTGDYTLALGNILVSVVLCLLATFGGFALMKNI